MLKKILTTILLFGVSPTLVQAVTISNPSPIATTIKQYEKYEIRFSINSQTKHPFFAYETSVPPGVTPATGITVEGKFISPSGKVLTQPGFYMHETQKVGSGNSMYFEETGNNYWVVRISPQEIGTYQVSLSATDSSGTATTTAGIFTAISGTNPGFIRVSKQDPKYFEFSNSTLFWPNGPAWPDNVGQTTNTNAKNYDTSQYSGTGINLYRPWMAGRGVYSTNWARWPRNDKSHGNEGIESALSWAETAPGSELSYELDSSIGATSYWLQRFSQEMFAFRMKNTCYKAILTYKATNLSGSVNIRPWTGWPSFKDDQQALTQSLQNQPNIIGPISSSSSWTTITANVQGNNSYDNMFIYMAAGTTGKINIDQFSLRELVPNKSCNTITGQETLGAEIIRNPKADIHTYVDDRAAAYFDWLLTEGEQYGVYYKLVVHDKNDWVQSHINPSTGTWTNATLTWPYYVAENTKGRWLLKQWYRYLAARWGYSVSVHSWELNNEGPPDDGAGHWQTTQSFAKYMHTFDSHPHLASTSFWCCWRPTFWGNKSLFPDVDYADIHDYSGNSETTGFNYLSDPANGMIALSNAVASSNIGRPTMIGEQGLTNQPEWWNPATDSSLTNTNEGTWWRRMQWAAAFHPAAVSTPNYWFPSHLGKINREQISTILAGFIKNADWNRGGYIDAGATSTVRIVGKKNPTNQLAYLWVQNNNQSAIVSIPMKPNIMYDIAQINTATGTKTTQLISSTSTGLLTISVSASNPDTGIKITPQNYNPSPPTALIDLLKNYNSTTGLLDKNNDNLVNLIDFAIASKL